MNHANAAALNLRTFDSNCSNPLEAKLCVCLTDHSDEKTKELYNREVIQKIEEVSKACLLVEDPADTLNGMNVSTKCWEDVALQETIDKKFCKLDNLDTVAKNLLSPEYPIPEKLLAIERIKTNAKVLGFPINTIDPITLEQQLKNINTYRNQLETTQTSIKEWLLAIRHAFINQITVQTFARRQTNLITQTDTALKTHDQVVVFCGRSHADPTDSINPPEAIRYVDFIKSLNIPYAILTFQ